MLAGLPAMLLCRLLQAIFLSTSLRRYARFRLAQQGRDAPWVNVLVLSTVMLLMLLGNFAQMIIWAGLFLLLGEFGDFANALYHSGVNSSRWVMATSSCRHGGAFSGPWRQPTVS